MMSRPGLNIQTFEFGQEKVPQPYTMQDENITVEAILLYPHAHPEEVKQDLPLEKAILHHHFVKHLSYPPNKKNAKRKRDEESVPPLLNLPKSLSPLSEMTQKALEAYLRSFQTSERPLSTPNASLLPVAMTYYIKGPTKPGKFDAQVAKALGVFGPDRSKLVKGETVVLPNGDKVEPHQVIGEAAPGAVPFCSPLFFLPRD